MAFMPSRAGFIAILFCFALPFFTVTSCDEQPVTLTGFDLAGKGYVPGGSEGGSEQSIGQVPAILTLVVVAAGLAACFVRRPASAAGWSVVFAVGTFWMLVVLWADIAARFFTDVSVGIGWWLALIAAAAVGLRGIVLMTRFRTVGPPTAGARRRLAAGVVDLLLVAALCGLGAILLLPAIGHDLSPLADVALAMFVPLGWIYRTASVASRLRATPGKALAGLEVTDLEGRALTIRRSALRSTARWTSPLTFGIGSSTVLFTSDGRAVHDIFAGTMVVSRRASG